MEIIPIKQKYVFEVAKHTMSAIVLHKDKERVLNYYFDDKLVAKKSMPGGEYYTDDECISEVVDDYRKNNKGVYADLLNHHIDKIHLAAKILEVEIVNYGMAFKAKTKIVKDYYDIEIATDDSNNIVKGRIKADNFPDVLEKMRLFLNTLAGVSDELSQNITLLSNDKIEESISWN